MSLNSFVYSFFLNPSPPKAVLMKLTHAQVSFLLSIRSFTTCGPIFLLHKWSSKRLSKCAGGSSSSWLPTCDAGDQSWNREFITSTPSTAMLVKHSLSFQCSFPSWPSTQTIAKASGSSALSQTGDDRFKCLTLSTSKPFFDSSSLLSHF